MQAGQQKIPNPKHDVYFEGNKKNQLNELKNYFKSILSNPDLGLYRKEVIKKIITMTTQGIDTSRFYPEMVIASGTKDLIQKKLIFFYLANYSQNNPDFARMAINTFNKDADSPNPNVRALAIRHLSDLHFKGREEYVMPILRQGLNDFNAHVKKACLMGITKLISQQNWRKSEKIRQQGQQGQIELQRNQQLLDLLYGLLRDNDPYVVCCVMQAINQIQPQGIAMSKKLTHYLIKNIQKFPQFQLSRILTYVELYQPKQQSEILQFLNSLDGKLRSQSLSLTLSICKLYLKYGQLAKKISSNSENSDLLLQRIHLKIKPALLSFIGSDTHQVQFIALKQLYNIICTYDLKLYTKQIKKFYLKQDEPSYLQQMKIRLLEQNCIQTNFTDVINQFFEYIKDPALTQTVCQSLSGLIMRLNITQAKSIMKGLNSTILTLPSLREVVCSYGVHTVQSFLRRFPQEFSMLQPTFYIYVESINGTSGRCAMIQIIGQFGQLIQNAVQLILWSQKNIQDTLKISLLRANVKLFLKRPLQMTNILINMFRQVLSDQNLSLYVRDYAVMLYRALQADVDGFRKVYLDKREFGRGKPIDFGQEKNLQCNTLQIIYGKPKSEWLIQKGKYMQLIQEIQYSEQPTNDNQHQIQSPQQIQLKNRQSVQLKTHNTVSPQSLNPSMTLSAEQFEMYWQQFEICSSITRLIKEEQLPHLTQETLEQLFNLWSINVIASIDNQENIKQYLYTQLVGEGYNGDIVCLELTVNREVGTLGLIIKMADEGVGGFVSKYVQDFLRINQIL